MVYVLQYGLLKRKQTMKTFGDMVFGDETIHRKNVVMRHYADT